MVGEEYAESANRREAVASTADPMDGITRDA